MRICLPVSLVAVSSAFTVPQTRLVTRGKRSVRIMSSKPHQSVDELNGELIQKPTDMFSPVEDVMAPLEDDLGKEIFLSGLEENAKIVSSLDLDQAHTEDTSVKQFLWTAEGSESNLSETSLNTEESASQKAFDATQAAVAHGVQGGNTDLFMDDNVSAVLARAEEAVAEMETLKSADLPVDTGSKDATADQVEAPSVKKILRFAIPAIGVWLCGPLLSLIDTSAVGILSGTTQQAALNPAVAVTEYAALLIAFLYTGTTNLVAAARESDRGVEGSPRATRTFVGGLQLSGFVGFALGLILFGFARPLLRAIIGNDGISPAVFDAALKYVRIRALGMPAAAVIGSAQAASLGMQDIQSPLYVLGAAALVNLLGDVLFVGNANAWIGGAAGAAWATVFSQYAAMSFFIHWLCNKPKATVLNLSKAILELTGKPSTAGESRRKRFRDTFLSIRSGSAKTDETSPVAESDAYEKKTKAKTESVTVRGFLKDSFRARDLFKFPSKSTIDDYSEYVVPVTSTQVGRVSGYVAMSHVVSSSLGTIGMAAQQVIVSLFYCLTPIADSLSLTAQSFVPSISEKKPSPARTLALRKVALNFLQAGAVFGAAMCSAVCSIPLLSQFFTSDPAVVALVNSVAPLLLGVFAVHGLVCSAEGMLLGQKDLNYLGKMYAGYFVVVPYFMLRVKRAALSGLPVNLTSVWKVFLSYQLFRCAAWLTRVAMLQRRTARTSSKLLQP